MPFATHAGTQGRPIRITRWMTPRPKKEPLLCARNNATAFVAAISNPEITRIEEVRRSHVRNRACIRGIRAQRFYEASSRRRLAQLRLARLGSASNLRESEAKETSPRDLCRRCTLSNILGNTAPFLLGDLDLLTLLTLFCFIRRTLKNCRQALSIAVIIAEQGNINWAKR